MIVKEQEYIKHWGVKGMKWGGSGGSNMTRPEGGSFGGGGLTEEEATALEEENGLTKMWGYDENGNQTGLSGYVDEVGNQYPSNLDDALKAKKSHDSEMENYKKGRKAVSKSAPITRKSQDLYSQLYDMAPALKKQRDKAFKKAVHEATIKDIKSIPSDAVKKGKSFVSNFFKQFN